LAGPHLLNAFSDDPLVRRKPLAHNDVGAADGAGLDAADDDLFAIVDHQNERTGLIDLERLLRHDEHVLAISSFRHDGDQLAVDQDPIGIGKTARTCTVSVP
jgi:hypothetical protein